MADRRRGTRAVLTRTFEQFFRPEKIGALLLIGCTLFSLAAANSAFGPAYRDFWDARVAGMSVHHWINDALMAVFFLFVGLELEREVYVGELADLRSALLPIVAAAGGIAVPAAIHYALNVGTATQAGAGIPMATDIAFALGVLALLGDRATPALRIFLVAVAMMDDLGAILVIGLLYARDISFGYLAASLAVFAALVVLNRRLRVMALAPYLIGGAVMWYLMLRSGVHATLAGVMLAFAIPFSARAEDETSPSHRLEHFLRKPVVFVVLPVFALANTAILIGGTWQQDLLGANGLGILAGLVVGKPVGIFLASLAAVALGICRLPEDLAWRQVLGAGMLGGIGFTMSIFIANLAYPAAPEVVNASKMAILVASSCAGVIGLAWLRFSGSPAERAE